MSNYIPKVGEACEIYYQDEWRKTFIVGINSDGELVFEVPEECAHQFFYDIDLKEEPSEFRKFKTPEQVEEEKAIEDIENVLLLALTQNFTLLAKALHEAGYHNQPKVKPLSWE